MMRSDASQAAPEGEFGLNTILPSPILYGVWHKKGGLWGAYIAQWPCISIAIWSAWHVGGGAYKDNWLPQ